LASTQLAKIKKAIASNIEIQPCPHRWIRRLYS
jgi:hypothetical protein